MPDLKAKVVHVINLYSCAMTILWICAFGFSRQWGQEAITKQGYSTSNLNQFSDDWTRSPFSELVVTEESFCPQSHRETVVTRPWYGLNLGCDCRNITSYATKQFYVWKGLSSSLACNSN